MKIPERVIEDIENSLREKYKSKSTIQGYIKFGGVQIRVSDFWQLPFEMQKGVFESYCWEKYGIDIELGLIWQNNKFRWSVNPYNRHGIEKIRKEAQIQAFETAFKLIEEKL